MTAKGVQTRQRIIDAARQKFSEKGYCAVTMKDICDAARISRGGLYSYFSSTADIFACMIEDEQAHAYSALESALSAGRTADEIVLGFICSRLSRITSPAGSISTAITEFAKNSDRGRELVRLRAESSVRILSEMLQIGQRAGIYRDFDATAAAHSLLWLIEGMSAHRELFELSYDEAFSQMQRFLHILKA